MLRRCLFSPGKALFVRRASIFPLSRPLPPRDTSELPAPLRDSLLAPELAAFDQILRQIGDSRTSDFEILAGPFRLRQKLLVRALLGDASVEPDTDIDLAALQSRLAGGFGAEFEAKLAAQGLHAGSDVSLFIENLRERFQALEAQLRSGEKASERWFVFLQLLLNVLICSVLFYTTYFWKDWEVVEPISYLVLVAFNFVYFASLIYFRKVSGKQPKLLFLPITSRFLKRRLNYALNRKQFESFYFEYREILRKFN